MDPTELAENAIKVLLGLKGASMVQGVDTSSGTLFYVYPYLASTICNSVLISPDIVTVTVFYGRATRDDIALSQNVQSVSRWNPEKADFVPVPAEKTK